MLRLLAIAIPSLAIATIAASLLEDVIGVPNASAVYLAAVVVTALVAGTSGAVVAAVAAFLLYDYLFVQPLYTFTVADPGEWLNLVLLLFIGIVVGQLVALQRARTETARAREREARALFQVSRALATRESTPAVLPTIAAILRDEIRDGPRLDRARDRRRAGAGRGRHRAAGATADRRDPARAAADARRRARQMGPRPPAGRQRKARGPAARRTGFGSREARRNLGSIWALRERDRVEPDRTETRLLSAAADQIGQALAHDRLAAESQAAEIARQSDALKSALLQSVSHDLRTPLATIRAAAGTLRPGSGLSEEDQLESAEAIDREVEYLNRLVTNLLDLSRIEAGALRAERDVFELDDLVGRTVERLRTRLGARPLDGRPGCATGRGRPRAARRSGDQRARERHQVHVARDRRPDRRSTAARRTADPVDDRGRWTRRAGRRPAAAVREVLPGAGRPRRLTVGHGHRPRGRPGPGRGDGRAASRPGAASSAGLAIDIDLEVADVPAPSPGAGAP